MPGRHTRGRFLFKKGFDVRKRSSGRPMVVAKRALKLAKSNATIEFTTFQAFADEMLGSFFPQVVYIQPAIVDSVPAKQTLLFLRGAIILGQDPLSEINDLWRVDVILDRTPSGVTLNLLKCYGDTTPQITRPLNYAQSKRYKLLQSRRGVMAPNIKSHTIVPLNVRINLIAEADAKDPTQASIMKNAVYLVFWTSAQINKPSFGYNFDMVSRTT